MAPGPSAPGQATLVSLAEIFSHGTPQDIARAEALLGAFHRDIYVPAFPDPSERENMEEWLPLLHGSVKEGYTLHPELLVSAEGRVLAGLLWEHYEHSHSVLATYLATHPAARRMGAAARLVGAMAEHAKALPGGTNPPIYAELRDPHRTPPETRTEDLARLPILDGLGFRLLDCGYLQPPLEPHGPYCDHLRLACLGISLPPGSNSLPASAISGFLEDFFACLSLRTGETPSPAWRALLGGLHARETVALQRLTSLAF